MLFVAFRRSRALGRALLAAACGLLLNGLPVAALGTQPRPGAGTLAYVYLRGTDTLAVEQVTPGNDTIRGTLHAKGAGRVEWDLAHADRTPVHLTVRAFAPGDTGTGPAQVATFALVGDSMRVSVSTGGGTQSLAFATRPGAVPLVNASVLHAVILADHAIAAGRDTLPVFLTSGARTLPAVVARHADSVTLTIAPNVIRWRRTEGPPEEIRLPSQGLRIVRSATPIRVREAPPSYDAPAGAPYAAEHVRIPSGRGYELAATLTRPTGIARPPVVVTISGSGPQDRDSRIGVVPGYALFREIADTLGRRGIAVLRFDDRAVGASGGREGADRATTEDVAGDVRAVLAWLRARADVDGDRVVLVGHSEGGIVAPLVAAGDPRLAGIALLAGSAYDGRRILEYQNAQAIANAPGLTDRQRDSLRRVVPGALDSLARTNPWMGFFMRHDPLATIRAVRQPVLILHGDTDHQVTPEQADTLAAALAAAGNRRVTARRFPATNHLFLADPDGRPQGYAALKDVRVRREVLGALADWVAAVVR
jgi:dienelactone hydrolase